MKIFLTSVYNRSRSRRPILSGHARNSDFWVKKKPRRKKYTYVAKVLEHGCLRIRLLIPYLCLNRWHDFQEY